MPVQCEPETPSVFRAWCFLVWLGIQRQARAHMMVWIALVVLALTVFVVGLNTGAGRWSMGQWRLPRRTGPTYQEYLTALEQTRDLLSWDPMSRGGIQATTGAIRVTLEKTSGFFVFSNYVVFILFTTFLLPLWSLSFATEGIGREREARTLTWLLTRPIPRPAIFLAKYLAVLPWCLALNLGGLWLICLAGGVPGQMAIGVYWPAVLWGTFAFCSLFHLIAACARRPALVAILYSFFLETLMGNLPGYLKRFSISFYTRCMMFDRAHSWGIHPERPAVYLPVEGFTAWSVLVSVTVLGLLFGMFLFSRKDYLEVI